MNKGQFLYKLKLREKELEKSIALNKANSEVFREANPSFKINKSRDLEKEELDLIKKFKKADKEEKESIRKEIESKWKMDEMWKDGSMTNFINHELGKTNTVLNDESISNIQKMKSWRPYLVVFYLIIIIVIALIIFFKSK